MDKAFGLLVIDCLYFILTEYTPINRTERYYMTRESLVNRLLNYKGKLNEPNNSAVDS
jgi:hypothetical protein